jgi:hypothetical protein
VAAPKNKKRRSRKRPGAGTDARAAAARPATTLTKAERARRARAATQGPPTLKADRSEAPSPIWAPLPITEGLILVGLVLAAVGLFSKSVGLVLGGLALVLISSLELAVREHLAGYRSHTSLISAVVALACAAGLGLLLNALDVGLPQWPLLVVAALVFAGMFRVLRRAFQARSGGLSYRV